MPNNDVHEILNTPPRGTLDENEACVSAVFHLDKNEDVITRRFEVCGFAAMIAYLEGLSDGERISESIVRACVARNGPCPLPPKADRLRFIAENVISAAQISEAESFREITNAILAGVCVLFAEDCEGALLIDVRSMPHRSVNRTNNESVVLGSQEGFVENLRTNISLIRKNLRSADLITEKIDVGSGNKMPAALLYLDGVTDADTVKEAKRRLKRITAEGFKGTGQIQQLIEDHPYALFPQILQTERPDRAAAGLLEGQFAILTDNSPYALLGPVTIFHFLHASDDDFMRWQYASFIRIIRLIGVLFSLMLPGVYIALTQYHTHLLPMNLLSSIAEARANVPFSILGEILIMEFSFNLINEAGTRIPAQIGSALGIVGALILGQAAVSASIASPILIIIVALTGLGNFVIPSYSLELGIQLWRLLILLAGAFFGLYGIVLACFLLAVTTCAMRSFGSPYVAPVAPKRRGNCDILLSVPIRFRKFRMFFAAARR